MILKVEVKILFKYTRLCFSEMDSGTMIYCSQRGFSCQYLSLINPKYCLNKKYFGIPLAWIALLTLCPASTLCICCDKCFLTDPNKSETAPKQTSLYKRNACQLLSVSIIIHISFRTTHQVTCRSHTTSFYGIIKLAIIMAAMKVTQVTDDVSTKSCDLQYSFVM